MKSYSIKSLLLNYSILLLGLITLSSCARVRSFVSERVIPDNHSYTVEINEGNSRYIYNTGTKSHRRPLATLTDVGFVISAGRNIERNNYPVEILIDIGDKDEPEEMVRYPSRIRFKRPGVSGTHSLGGTTIFTRISEQDIVGHFAVSGDGLNASFVVELINEK